MAAERVSAALLQRYGCDGTYSSWVPSRVAFVASGEANG
jgi:hypothetical protein